MNTNHPQPFTPFNAMHPAITMQATDGIFDATIIPIFSIRFLSSVSFSFSLCYCRVVKTIKALSALVMLGAIPAGVVAALAAGYVPGVAIGLMLFLIGLAGFVVGALGE
jgi:hypothetical protein